MEHTIAPVPGTRMFGLRRNRCEDKKADVVAVVVVVESRSIVVALEVRAVVAVVVEEVEVVLCTIVVAGCTAVGQVPGCGAAVQRLFAGVQGGGIV